MLIFKGSDVVLQASVVNCVSIDLCAGLIHLIWLRGTWLMFSVWSDLVISCNGGIMFQLDRRNSNRIFHVSAVDAVALSTCFSLQLAREKRVNILNGFKLRPFHCLPVESCVVGKEFLCRFFDV